MTALENEQLDNLVEVANLEDVPEIVSLCYKNYYEIGAKLPKPNTKKALSFMSDLVQTGLVFVYRDKETQRIEGLLGLTPFEFWWSEEPVLHAVSFYVTPNFRKEGVGKLLLTQAKDYAKINKVRLYVDIMTDQELDKKEVFLRRERMEKMGSLFMLYDNSED